MPDIGAITIGGSSPPTFSPINLKIQLCESNCQPRPPLKWPNDCTTVIMLPDTTVRNDMNSNDARTDIWIDAYAVVSTANTDK
jgi:hypothetical protein